MWAEPVFLEFDLRQMPRRGDERVLHGRVWGARDPLGSVTHSRSTSGEGAFPTAS